MAKHAYDTNLNYWWHTETGNVMALEGNNVYMRDSCDLRLERFLWTPEQIDHICAGDHHLFERATSIRTENDRTDHSDTDLGVIVGTLHRGGAGWWIVKDAGEIFLIRAKNGLHPVALQT